MRIHIFRSVRDPEDARYFEGSPLSDKYPLYAYTDKKKYARRFMKERDMHQFVHLTIERDGDEVDKWCKKHQGQELQISKLQTYVYKNTNKQTIKFVPVLLTNSELNFVLESIDSGGMMHYIAPKIIQPSIFKSSIEECLDHLGYTGIANYILDEMKFFSNATTDVIAPYYKASDYELDPMTYDQYGSFILIYKNILTPYFYIGLELLDDVEVDTHLQYPAESLLPFF
jgi:hypothetical protein